MTDRVTVNRDRTKLLPPNSPEKGWRITRKEAKELGLLKSEENPVQKRRDPFNGPLSGTPTTQRRRKPKSE